MRMELNLTEDVKRIALEAGADIVGVASINRFEHAPKQLHPHTILGSTRSVIAMGVRMVRGALKAAEEGKFWQAYNCDSYQYLNEVLAPHMLRKVVMFLEDQGYTSVPLHNPFHPGSGRPVRPGAIKPDGMLSLRVVGCAAGLGELGRSKLFLSPQFGPRQRMFAIYTDAPLEADPLLEPGSVCDDCGACSRGCPAEAIAEERTVEVKIDDKLFRHAPLDCSKCSHVHQGWDPRVSPFLKEEHSKENPPGYFQFLDKRFRHRSICVGRGCVRACMDHLEKSGKIEKQYKTPMIEGKQWVIE